MDSTVLRSRGDGRHRASNRCTQILQITGGFVNIDLWMIICERDSLINGNRLSAGPVLARLSLQQLPGDEVLTVRFVDLANRTDFRMIERGRRESFLLEALAGGRIVLQFFRQELQRNMAVQLEVFDFVHHTHPATPKLVYYAIVRDGFAERMPG
jgi:hypothetical protein